MVRPAERRSAGLLPLALAAGAAACAHVRGTPQAPAVIHVHIDGAHAVAESEIVAKLATHPSDRPPPLPIIGPIIFQTTLQLGGADIALLDPDALSADRRRVEAFYRQRGYYRARVEDVQVLPAGPGRVDVVFRVDEGPPVRVTKLTINGLDEEPEAKARVARLPLGPGDVFTEAAYDATKKAIHDALLNTGWATAEVGQQALVLPEQSSAEVTYDVRPGPRYRFGPIFVAGTSSVPRDRILQQVTAAIKPGDWWDESKLPRAQARVFDLGVFGGVRIARGPPDPQNGRIPVVIAVREAPFRTIRAGPGLAIDVRRWEALGSFSWQDRNFHGGLRNFLTEERAGYAWVPNPYSPVRDGPIAFVAGELRQPAAFTRYIDASVRVELERGIQDAYDYWSERLRLGLPLRIASRWTLVPSYNLEVYQLSHFAAGFVPGATPTTPTTVSPILQNCPGSVCLLSYLEQRIAWDGRDDAVNTRRGYYVSLAVQEGFTIQSYGYQYLRLLPELRAFYPLNRRTVLAFRTRVGALIPIHETGVPPVPALLLAGGPLSMRGYYTNRLAPMVLQNGEWVPVGGNGISDGSLELRFDVTRNLGMAVFVDAGTASAATAKPSEYKTSLDPTRLQWAAGLGLRYRTPFGPIRVDVAMRLPERLGADIPAHNFPPVPYAFLPDGTQVEHREPIIAVHFALGEAF